MRIKNHLHISGSAVSLALKQRLETTRKWPINAFFTEAQILTVTYEVLFLTFSQAKQVHIKLDDRIISPPEGFLLRKG